MNLIQQFRSHLIALGYRKHSVNMLPACSQEFLEFTQKNLQEITKTDIKNYHEYLHIRPNFRRAGGLSERYISHQLYSLKVFFAWLQEMDYIFDNPMNTLQFKTPKMKPRVILQLTDIQLLYTQCQNLQERAILSIFYGCGLRRSEAENLVLSDIHFRENLLYVQCGKNSKRRVVPINEMVKKDLENYILYERPKNDEVHVFCNHYGRKMYGDCFARYFKKLLERANLPIEITLHSLRHSIATHLLDSGVSLEHLRDFLGHSDLESTQLYTQVNDERIWNLSTI